MHEERRRHYLQALGVDLWQVRSATAAVADAAPTDATVAMEPAVEKPAPPPPRDSVAPPLSKGAVADLEWEELEATVATCRLCGLCDGRKQTVFGCGARDADWMIVGEAPGAEEDRLGEPFVGAAGKLLDAMLRAVGLAREQVFIANTLKCRPPGNRDPHVDELAACRPYLERQIALVRPRLLLVVGRIAAQALLASDEPIGRLRGRVHELPGLGVPLVPTYHPAYLLRSPDQKRRAWQDLLLARSLTVGDGDGGPR
ncbi:MAG: uracil-DNA glycosylase [Gammaproteobacteria bacterium]|nr:MAG: uracil-DNA glycosylase [Gammaproteobacteria bacterium]